MNGRAALAQASLVVIAACGFDGAASGPIIGDVSGASPPGSSSSPVAPPPTAPTAPPTAPPPPACTDNVLSFDGVDDVASVPDDTRLDLDGDFTVEAWIKPSASAATGPEVDLVSHHDPGASRGWAFLLNVGHVEIVVFGDETFAPRAYSAGNSAGPMYVVAGKWAHVAGTLQGNTLRVYYDGVLRDTQQLGTFFGRASYQGRLMFGRASATADFRYAGEIDDVRLSTLARYTSGVAPKPTAPVPSDAATVAAWRFDEATGATLVDAQARHNGTFGSGDAAPTRVASTCISAR